MSLLSFGGVLVALAGVVAYVAYRTRRVPTPRRPWRRFRQASPLPAAAVEGLQGIYAVEEGRDFFGGTAVIKCSRTVERGATLYRLSFFCEKNGTYFICEGRQHNDVVLLYGHWRRAAANGTGLVRLALHPGADKRLQGHFGRGNKKPDNPLRLQYQRPLPPGAGFEVIGHRGGARNVDFLPVSENSLSMMRTAAQLGATGVEIDVRLTADGVPVVFHDSFLSVHTTRGPLYGGLLHGYALRQLKRVRLRKGGTVPTLEECLHTVLHETPLRTVWLDVKKECDLESIRALQHRYLREAKALKRELYIYIGVPNEALLGCFTRLADYRAVPSLSELTPDKAMAMGADVWAPQYTGGLQKGNVAKVQAAGLKAFVWSLDNRFLIDLFITKGGFDGVVTNTPSVAAHWWYTQGASERGPKAGNQPGVPEGKALPFP